MANISNIAVVNGKRYTLPNHQSLSINNNDIYLDGKRWIPPSTPRGPLTRRTFILSTDDADNSGGSEFTRLHAPPSSFEVFGGRRIVVSEHDEPLRSFKAVLEIEAPSLSRVRVKHNLIDVSRVREIESCTVHLHVPTGHLRKLQLEGIQESVEIGGIDAPEMTLSVSRGSGNMTATACSFKSMDMTFASGHCVLKEIICPTVRAVTSRTDIEIHDGDITVCEIQTMSGDVDLAETKVDSSFLIHTMSGDVCLSDTQHPGGSITTMSGDVSIYENSSRRKSGGVINVNTMSGGLRGHAFSRVRYTTQSGRDRLRRVETSGKRPRDGEGEEGVSRSKKPRPSSSSTFIAISLTGAAAAGENAVAMDLRSPKEKGSAGS
jgi:hypothetical protein